MALITIVATWLASETYQHDIHADYEPDRDLAAEARRDQPPGRAGPVPG
jgi:hypothetical protein